MLELETIELTVNQSICTIALNRPHSLNAMNRRLIDEVALAFDYANANEQVRVIVFTGNGRAFCAGDDRHEHQHPENEAEARDLVDAIQRATEAIIFGEKLVVGAINGWAVGGGFEWAINCDFALWGSSAKGFFPEVCLNIFVTGAVTTLLPAIVGLNKAKEMLLLGEHYDAKTLQQLGVAYRVVEDDQLLDQANNLALKLAALPVLSCASMKRVLNQTSATDLPTALRLETEATVQGMMDPLTTRLLQNFK